MTEVNEAPKGANSGGDEAEPLLKLRGIDKHFGPVQALYGVNLDLPAGQVTGLCGDKAVMWNSKLVLLDEPTAALGVVQTRQVLDLIKRLRDHGLAVMVISHNLNDVFEVADRIAVLYLGRMVVEGPAADFDRQSVVEYMTTGGANGRPPDPARSASDEG